MIPGFAESSFKHISTQSGCKAGTISWENGRCLHELMFLTNWKKQNLLAKIQASSLLGILI